MKRNSLLLLFLVPLLSYSQGNAFESFYKKTFKELPKEFSTEKLIIDQTGIDVNVISENHREIYKELILKYEAQFLENAFLYKSQGVVLQIPLGYYNTSKYILLFYMQLKEYENDNLCNELLVKSFTPYGDFIDSLVIDSFFPGEVDIKKRADVKLKNEVAFVIKQKTKYELDEELYDRENTVPFTLGEDGVFRTNPELHLFEFDNYYISASNYLHDYTRDCSFIKEQILGDLNFDGYKDAVIVVENDNAKCSTFKKLGILLGISNRQNVFLINISLFRVFLNPDLYTLHNLSINSGLLSFNVSKRGEQKYLVFKIGYSELIDKWRVVKILAKNKQDENFEENISFGSGILVFPSAVKLIEDFYEKK